MHEDGSETSVGNMDGLRKGKVVGSITLYLLLQVTVLLADRGSALTTHIIVAWRAWPMVARTRTPVTVCYAIIFAGGYVRPVPSENNTEPSRVVV